MFAIHRRDPRRSEPEALDAAQMHAGMFLDDTPSAPGSMPWALRLYDLAFLCFEVRENLAGRRISPAVGDEARRLLERVKACLLQQFPALGPIDRISAACDGLQFLVRCASEGTPDDQRRAFRMAHVNAQWLQNVAHNAYLDAEWRKAQGAERAAVVDALREEWSPVTVLIPRHKLRYEVPA
ncbi:hypothetical protein [Tranquillimonas alkanivorans]|uniref:Uncharacterized protein n=1 Tax=Tranquillimonas alkanivorans TaxID=441119 RepID=A0A1I5PC16_9RHOB|nr:hypothetical protein [Tranquillimonas alkanivorans]SFP31642.1 hypothetical protein SAMN04488047_10529 [Tranquillimonas alkanivorans]